MFPITCESFIAIGWTVYAPEGKVQHRVLQLVQFLIFCISKTTVCMFTTTCESFIAISWMVCAPAGQHRVLQLVQFFIFYFQNHREHVYNNLWKFHRNRMNGVRSCRATPGTPTSTILISFLISKTTVSMFTTTCESFIAMGWTVCTPIRDKQRNIHLFRKLFYS